MKHKQEHRKDYKKNHKNINKSFLKLTSMQKEVLPSHKLQDHAYE